MYFQIHEEKENSMAAFNRCIEDRKAIYNVPNKLTLKQSLENRRVLGPVTNVRHPGIQNTQVSLPRNTQTHVSAYTDDPDHDETVQSEDENLLSHACALLPSQIPNVTPTTINSYFSEASTADVSMVEYTDQNDSDVYNDDNITIADPIYKEYVYEYLRKAEHNHRPHPQYMKKQLELNDNMRCILIDWLVAISDEYEFASETLYLAVSFIDRFLSKMSVVRTKFQLLGVTSMMIAAKYEEVHPPDIYEFSSLTKDTCTVRQILKMEQMILRVLSFDLVTPTIQTFIDEYSHRAKVSRECTNMAMLISELCLVESVYYIKYFPSEIAASSIALSRHTLEEDIWPKEYETVCGYTWEKLYPIMKMQHKVFDESPNKSLQAVRQKYSKNSLRNVSSYKPRKLI